MFDVVWNPDYGNVRGFVVRYVVRGKRRTKVVIFSKNVKKLKKIKMF